MGLDLGFVGPDVGLGTGLGLVGLDMSLVEIFPDKLMIWPHLY